MIWFTLAIFSAIFQSLKQVYAKKNLKNISSDMLVFLLSLFWLIFWLPFVIYFWFPELSLKFILIFLFSGSLFYIWKIFNYKALEVADISYLSPLKSLLTIWVLIISAIFLKEYPSFLWYLWIFFILIGVYLLNTAKYHTKFLDPFINIAKNKWARLYFVMILCYSITTILDRVWVAETYPIFWIFSMNFFIFLFSLRGFLKVKKKELSIVRKNFLPIFITFIFYALTNICQMTAIDMIFIWYFSAIKISSMLFSIILWWIFFKEKDIKKKLLIWLLIVLGVILIMIW